MPTSPFLSPFVPQFHPLKPLRTVVCLTGTRSSLRAHIEVTTSLPLTRSNLAGLEGLLLARLYVHSVRGSGTGTAPRRCTFFLSDVNREYAHSPSRKIFFIATLGALLETPSEFYIYRGVIARSSSATSFQISSATSAPSSPSANHFVRCILQRLLSHQIVSLVQRCPRYLYCTVPMT